MRSTKTTARRRLVVASAIFALLAVVSTGCSSYESPRFGGSGEGEEPGYDQQVDNNDFEPEPQAPAEVHDWTSDDAVTDPGSGHWTCSYSPTYDRDWHNDVLCTNGTEAQRPQLREWDSYVTQDEIMESAGEYETQLNGG